MTDTPFRVGDTVGFKGRDDLRGKLLQLAIWYHGVNGAAPEYRWFVRLDLPQTGAHLWTREEYLRPLSAEEVTP